MERSHIDKNITVLGSTGSVGTQALDVARLHGLHVSGISLNTDIRLGEEQIREFSPAVCAVADEKAAEELKIAVADTNTKILAGEAGICEMIAAPNSGTVVNAILGKAGLMPTLAAIKSRKKIAMSNKESLVIAGDIIMPLAKEYGVDILPVDSEHSAIYQCLNGSRPEDIARLIITASGGPFYGMTREQLSDVTKQMALAHPTWSMGAKITIDSATMMNKGLEVIEAHHLFGVPVEKIDVVVHRESIIHSMVEYIDNIIIAQMSKPDMRVCVQYALTSPAHLKSPAEKFDFSKSLTFSPPDTEAFPLLKTAFDAIRAGGIIPCAMNAANEIAVAAFLAEKISFTDIFDIIIETVSDTKNKSLPTIQELLSADSEAREVALKKTERIKR